MENIEEKPDNTPQKKLDMGRGCEFCNCGNESHATSCDGCFKLHTTDWLADYPENLDGEILEVRFKNTRRSYYHNVNKLPLEVGDIVAVEASPGHDIGIVSLTGDMVARQMRRVGFNPHNGEFKKIYRKAKSHDIEKWQEAIALEHNTMIRARQIAADMNLNMKIGDVEYQGDKIKAIFYYIADERVDFRELIKVFAEQFHIRVEMKQIGARQEAGRIGGLGSCGRELCCSSWMSSFTSVTTNAARTQDISLNPQKLAGQCSKLKCCLMYEYDDYMDALRDFPRVNEPLRVLDGDYYFVKNDILARLMSFSTAPNSMEGLVWISLDRVREIKKLNSKGVKPESIEDESAPKKDTPKADFVDLLGEDSITRFDASSKRKRNNKKGKQTSGNGSNGQATADSPNKNAAPKSGNRNGDRQKHTKPDNRNEADGNEQQNNKPRREQPGNTNNSQQKQNRKTVKQQDKTEKSGNRQPVQTNADNRKPEQKGNSEQAGDNKRVKRPKSEQRNSGAGSGGNDHENAAPRNRNQHKKRPARNNKPKGENKEGGGSQE